MTLRRVHHGPSAADDPTMNARATAPTRIQRRSSKGWRLPEGAVYVGAGTPWATPFHPDRTQMRFPRENGEESWEYEGRLHKTSGERHAFHHSDYTLRPDGSKQYRVTLHEVRDATAEERVALYREWVTGAPDMLDWKPRNQIDRIVTELAGRDLVCWCPLDAPCHADVLLDIANTTRQGQGS